MRSVSSRRSAMGEPRAAPAHAGFPAGCRACDAGRVEPIIDLGAQPAANTFPGADELAVADPRWPLVVGMCTSCHLVQLGPGSPAEAPPPIDPPVASTTIAAHMEAFVDSLVASGLAGPDRRIVELASHGGHLAPAFRRRGIVTQVVRSVDEDGNPVSDAAAFGRERAHRILAAGPADLVVDNYLLAHVADPADMVAGIADLLAPGAVAVLEMDYLLPLVEGRKFDAFRHGHYIYPSIIALQPLLERQGLVVLDVAEQPVYGGTLRVVVGRDDGRRPSRTVDELIARERAAGLSDAGRLRSFGREIQRTCAAVRRLIAQETRDAVAIAAYGAPSRGNTFLNACGLTSADIAFTVDASPAKQGRFLPGSRIPIESPSAIAERHPRAVLVLTWDLRAEIERALAGYLDDGGRLIFAIPRLEVVQRASADATAAARAGVP